jgi:hypothetical protein
MLRSSQRKVVVEIAAAGGHANIVEAAVFDRPRAAFGTEQALALLRELFEFTRGAE